jgi:hypothetical protein
LFRSVYVLQTFAAHFTAIEGSIVTDEDRYSKPKGALALSAAAVSLGQVL